MIFFDIDETLMQNDAAERHAAQTLYSLHAGILHYSLDDFLTNWKRLTEKNIDRYLAGELSFQDQRRERIRQLFEGELTLSDPEADAIFDSYLSSYEANWEMYPEVQGCLNDLVDVKLGIISNGDATQQRQKLHALGIVARFAIIMISGDVGVSKPDPGIFLAACQGAGVKPSECWHVGDDLKADFYGSKSAGMNGVWLNRNRQKPLVCIPTIESLSELMGHIECT